MKFATIQKHQSRKNGDKDKSMRRDGMPIKAIDSNQKRMRMMQWRDDEMRMQRN